jgi:hypothetical protein
LNNFLTLLQPIQNIISKTTMKQMSQIITAMITRILPQKPDDNLVSRPFYKVATLGRIHTAKTPVPSG